MGQIPNSQRSLVLLIDDDPDQRLLVSRFLESGGYDVASFASGAEGLVAMTRTLPDAILLDMQMEGLDGLHVLREVKATHPGVPVIMLTADGSTPMIMAATRQGADDYLVKNASDRAKILATVNRAVAANARQVELRQQRRAGEASQQIFGTSSAVQQLCLQIDRVATRDVTVLIHGESGTGKELVAGSIHQQSRRASQPFVAVNCGAITESLQNSELFGHEKGAFTGAVDRHLGLFERANRGTLFLDEVAELSGTQQVALLRVLQERKIKRVGGGEDIPLDIRIIAASHRSLAEAVERGSFRDDLYFRLAVFELDVPPLRERGEDVIQLARIFLQRTALQHRQSPRDLSEEAIACLLRWHWPGNVRELQNAMESALVNCGRSDIRPEHLPARIRTPVPPRPPPAVHTEHSAAPRPVVESPAPAPDQPRTLEEIQREEIAAALLRNRGSRTRASKELKIPRTTFYRLLERYQLK